MKKLFFAAALSLCMVGLQHVKAQVSISLNLNIGSQPDWGPTGYDHVEYYYLPDIDCYYYVPGKQFVYRSGSQWVWRSSLPPQYSNYNLYNSYKVVINKPKPYAHDDDYRRQYASYKGRHDQPMIRDSHDEKYKHRDNGRPKLNKPATNHPTAIKTPQRPSPEHRPESGSRPVPEKSKPGKGHDNGKKEGHGHH
ncbi:MAG TPA: hypothetical protein VHA56_22570 [Mucilaginibacter sp.]|nr:hypothetical protein [Mucilaginibacter sp.]